MKSALLGMILGLAIALLAITGSCSITHRSGDFACGETSECNTGRECIDGFCVVTGSVDAPHGTVDAAKTPDAPPACPPGCTSCNVAQKTCTIDCSLTSCAAVVTCPTDYHCDIQCDTNNSCRNGVDCEAGASCTVECSGVGSCHAVDCGAGPCDVSCSGTNSCVDVECNTSCACDVTCTGLNSCPDEITCTSDACRAGSGCTSVPAFCHTCN